MSRLVCPDVSEERTGFVYVNEPTRYTFLYIYLFYNFHVHSPCFERSSRSSSGVYRSVLYYTAVYNRTVT